jgi:hypothetical protein
VLLVVAESGDAVLTPAVGPTVGVVVGEVVPGVASGAVVLAHRAPLPFAQVRRPAMRRVVRPVRHAPPLGIWLLARISVTFLHILFIACSRVLLSQDGASQRGQEESIS